MNSKDMAIGYAIGYNDALGKSSGGGSSESEEALWEPPEDWIPVPEPGEYEMYFLIEPAGANKMQINIGYPEGFTGDETLVVDWGNGEVYDYSGMGYTWFYYNYTTTDRQYLVKVTLSKTNRCFFGISYDETSHLKKVLIAKLGSGIIFDFEQEDGIGLYGADKHYFTNQYFLRQVKINNPDGLLPVGLYGGAFQNCYRLRRVDTAAPAKVIPDYCFSNCYSLWNFDFSEVEEIGFHALRSCGFSKLALPKCTVIDQSSGMNCLTEISAPLLAELPEYAFYDVPCIKKVYLPSCTAIAAHNFYSCYRLTELTVDEGCVIDTEALKNAYNLDEIKYV